MRSTCWRLGGALLLVALMAGAAPAQMASRRVLVNRVAGFSIELPIDYEMTTNMAGLTLMGVNVTNYGSQSTPVYQFLLCERSAQANADGLAQAIRAVVAGAQVKVDRTGRPGEVRLVAETPSEGGSTLAIWFFREAPPVGYAISAVGLRSVLERHRDDVQVALGSCKLIQRPTLRVARDNTEDAFTVTMPGDWRYQGRIHRDQTCPGWAVWQASSPNGAIGCFELPPGQAMTPYTSVRDVHGTFLLRTLQGAVPQIKNLRPEQVTGLPRAAEALVDMTRLLGGPSVQAVRGDKSVADYLGEVNGVPVRVRLVASFVYRPFDAMPNGPGAEYWYLWGIWAPVQNFDELADLAHGVHGSFRSNPKWIAAQRQVVQDVLTNRTKVFEKAAADWDAIIRGSRPATDPATGKPLDVPNGTEPYRDDKGNVQYIPKGQTPPPGWQKIDVG